MSLREAAAAREPEQPGALWLRWESPRLQLGGEEARRRERAEALFAELFGHPPEKRSRVLKRRRFRDSALAELLLERSRGAAGGYPEVDDAEALLRAYWLEGRICSILGSGEDAEALLDGIRARFLDERRLPEAALASLDLALHRAESC